MNYYFLILYFLFGFALIGGSLLVMGIIIKAHISTHRKDMLWLLAGFSFIAISGFLTLIASLLELVVMPNIVTPLILGALSMGFLLISYSFIAKPG
jgi:hypothetical protein